MATAFALMQTRVNEITRSHYSTDRIKEEINVAYQEICSELAKYGKIDFLEDRTSFNTVVGTVEYALPSGTRDIVRLYKIDNNDEIELEYYRFRGKIFFIESPTSIFTIYADRTLIPADMVNTTDEPVIPERYRRLLILRASYMLLLEMADRDLWQLGLKMELLYTTKKEDMIRDFHNRKNRSKNMIPVGSNNVELSGGNFGQPEDEE